MHPTTLIRAFAVAVVTALLAACTQSGSIPIDANAIPRPTAKPPTSSEVVRAELAQAPEREPKRPDYAQTYGALEDGEYRLPGIDHARVDPTYLRQEVDYATDEPAGTIIVDTSHKFLYFVLGDGRAMRYGVSLGAQGRGWKGRAVIQWKRKWPSWTPTPAMIARNPKLETWKQGMPPGLTNPLGARALYIYQDGVDTLYRIHGSPEWQSIGKNASSGCVRMFNQDVIDLYDRVRGKSQLIVQ
ncbi:L,D-transpeptidase (plasmid) [Rhizobium grahamii]|uniref:L,D-transpeptidase n=1 Tax=Rhizobium grahamii TaxID=1120045 RepID=A0A5Q0CHL4_9HYPH|nr:MULTISPECIES: L,D-transpeptidase [Rhizobium]QFY63739.1 L,D-transpeptidase [Rhizobium grahamii]QRM51499.1 L,D-transpeptidase [Rhizobium sp. BG6]